MFSVVGPEEPFVLLQPQRDLPLPVCLCEVGKSLWVLKTIGDRRLY